jgi:hypothetical protein
MITDKDTKDQLQVLLKYWVPSTMRATPHRLVRKSGPVSANQQLTVPNPRTRVIMAHVVTLVRRQTGCI